MSRIVAWGLTAILAILLGVVTAYWPEWLGDANNKFLAGFVNHELLSFLGVVVTITLASAASLHLELNKLEDETGKTFPNTRRSIRLSSYSLIVLLAVGFVIVATKPFIAESQTLTAAWNSSALVLIVFNIFVLVDLTRAILAVPSKREINGD